MAFDFIVNTPRKEYKNTFLQNVFLSIHFDKIDQTSVSCNFNENWEKYIRTTFNNLEPRSNFFSEPISISREDRVCTIVLSNGLIGALIGAKDYRSFVDNVLPQLYKLKTFLKDVLDSPKISSISVRKVNIWQFNSKDKGRIDSDALRKSIFSGQFLNKKVNGQLDDNEKKIPNMHKYEWKDVDNNILAIARTVFMPRRQDGTFAQVLDTEAIYMHNDILLENLEEKSILLNNILYELYHWCINSKILKIMEDNNTNSNG